MDNIFSNKASVSHEKFASYLHTKKQLFYSYFLANLIITLSRKEEYSRKIKTVRRLRFQCQYRQTICSAALFIQSVHEYKR